MVIDYFHEVTQHQFTINEEVCVGGTPYETMRYVKNSNKMIGRV